MSMLEKICDVKNTFEGKALAVFLSALLAFSLVNASAFAADESAAPQDASAAQVDGAQESTPASTEPQSGNVAAEPVVEASEQPETAEPSTTPGSQQEEPSSSEPAKQSVASDGQQQTLSSEAPTAEPGVAVVGLDFEHAYITYLDQTIALPAESLNAPLGKELTFTAHADESYEVDKVQTVVDGVETDLVADKESGKFEVPAELVTSNLVLNVTGKAVAEAPSDVQAKPIDETDQAPANEAAEEAAPAVALTETVGGTTVILSAPAGVLPAGATMKVVPLEGDEVDVVASELAADEGRELVGYVAFDVTLYDAEDNEIEPAGAVSISLENASLDEGETAVYHAEEAVEDLAKVSDGPEAELTHLSPVMLLSSRAKTQELGLVGSGTRKDPYVVEVGGSIEIKGEKADSISWYSNDYDAEYVSLENVQSRSVVVRGLAPTSTPLEVTQKWWDDDDSEKDTYYVIVVGSSTENVLPDSLIGLTGPDTVAAGSAIQLTLETEPSGASTSGAMWSSSNSSLAIVDQNGRVTGMSAGQVEITVRAPSSSNGVLVQKKTVTVTANEGSWSTNRFYKLLEDSSNVQLFYSANGGTLTEIGEGETLVLNVDVPVAFYVKVLDGYAGNTTFWQYFGPTLESLKSAGPGQYGSIDKGNNDLTLGQQFAPAHEEALDYGCTFEFHYSYKPEEFRYRHFTITSNPILINAVYDLAGGSLNGSSTYVDTNEYTHSNVVEDGYASTKHAMTLAGAPTMDGKEFQGWRMSIGGQTYTVYAASQELAIASIWPYIAENIGAGSTTCDVTFTALWADKTQYSVTYDGNGATGGDPVVDNAMYYEDDEAIVKDNTYRKANSTFSGWSTSADGSGVSYASGDPLLMTGNVTLYAQWTSKGKSQISYYASPAAAGSVSRSSELVDPDTGVAQGATATAGSGYRFTGWTDGDGNIVSTDVDFVPTMPAGGWPARAKYYAQFEPLDGIAYTVQHLKVSADYTEASLAKEESLTGTTGESVSAVAKNFDGYTYQPAFDENGMQTVASGVIAGDGSLELKLYYTPDDDTLSYNANAADATGQVDATVGVVGETVSVADGAGFTRPGYNFAGWNTQADGLGANYAVGEEYTLTSGEDVLYAQWTEAVGVGLTYQAEQPGGLVIGYDGQAAEQVVETVRPVTGAPNGSTAQPASGYEFDGWYVDDVKVSESVRLDRDVIDASAKSGGIYVAKTFVAKFKQSADVTLTYVAAEGGTVNPESEELAPATGAAVGSTAAPKPGYSFVKWTALAADGSTVDVSTEATLSPQIVDRIAKATGVYEATTFTAHFEESTAVITYEADGPGSVSLSSETLPVVKGTAAGSKALSQPTTEDDLGSYFVGWSVGDSSDIISADIDLGNATIQQYAKSEEGVFVPTTFVAHFAAKKPLVITSKSETVYYDGAAHVAKDTYYSDNSVSIDGITAKAEETDVRKDGKDGYPVAFSGKENLVIRDKAGVDVTKQYKVTYEEGTLTILPRPVTISGAGWDADQPYTGTEYAKDSNDFKVESFNEAEHRGLVAGHSVTAEYQLAGTDVGEYEGSFGPVTITAGGKDVTHNYAVEKSEGSLTIVPTETALVISAVTKSWPYDGQPHSDNGYTVTYGGAAVVKNAEGKYVLPTGDEVTATVEGAVTNVADFPSNNADNNNKVTAYSVANQSFYSNIVVEDGALSITPRALTLASASAEKPYDGTPLTNDTVSVTEGSFVEGEGAEYSVTGSQMAIGFSSNVFEYTLKDGTVAENYDITKEFGELTVTALPDDAKFEITLEANSGEFTYDGTEKTVSGLKQTEFTFDNSGTFTVSGVEASASATNAGKPDVNVTGEPVVTDSEGNDVTDQFIIHAQKGALNIKQRPLALTSATLSKPYDGTPLVNGETPLATESGWVDGEGATYAFSGSVQLPGETAPNAFEIVPNAGTSMTNYAVKKTEGQLSIENRDAAYPVIVTANSGTFTYDGTQKSVSGFQGETAQGVPVQAEGRTYYVKGLTSQATGTNVADSVLSISVTGTARVFDEAGNDVSDQFNVTVNPGKLTIGQRSVILTSATDSKTYDGSALTNDSVRVTGDGFVAGEGASYSVTGSRTLVGSADNVFTYALAGGTLAGNYIIKTDFGMLTVTNREAKFEVSVEANSGTVLYDGTEKSVEGLVGETEKGVPVQANGLEFFVSGLTAQAAATDAGNYRVNVVGTPVVTDAEGNIVTDQFDVKTVAGALVINKRFVMLTSASAEKYYDGKALTNDTVSVAGDGWASGEGATYQVTGSQLNVGSAANAFSYTLTNATKESNYTVRVVPGLLVVKSRDAKFEISVEANSGTFTYDGTQKTVSGLKQTEFSIEGATFTVEGLTAEASGIDAKEYPVIPGGTLVVRDAEGNDVTSQFDVNIKQGLLKVEPRPLALASATLSKPYDGTPLVNGDTPLATESGWVDGEGATYAFSGSVKMPGATAPNAFEIVPNAGTNLANYAVEKTIGQLTIENRDGAAKYSIDMEANSGTFLYDGTEKTVSGFKQTEFTFGGATFTVAGLTASATLTDAGDTAVGVTGTPVVLDADGNVVTDQFKVTPVPGKLSVTPRTVVLQSASATKPYDGTALTDDRVDVQGDGWAPNEGADFAVTGSQKLVGFSDNEFTYTLKNGAKSNNYTIDVRFGRLTVTSRDAKYPINMEANSGTFLYDGTEKTVSGFKQTEFTFGGATFTVAGLTASAALTDAGEATVGITGTPVVLDDEGKDVSDQFSVKADPGKLTVQQRAVNLTSASADKEFDGQPLVAHSVIVSGDGWVEGEGASYAYTGSQTYVGTSLNHFTYTLNADTKASNYEIKPVEGRLTVKNRDVAWNATLTANSDTFTYDGAEKTVSGFVGETDKGVPVQIGGSTFYVTGLTAQATGTDAGTYTVQGVGTPTVLDANGRDVSDQFNVTVNPGLLTISKRQIVLESATASKPYDGKELTAPSVKVTGSWAAGEGADYTFTGSQELPGSSLNKFEYVLNGGAKEGNYDIDTRFGMLTVTNRDAAYQVTVQANSLTATYDGSEKSVSGFQNETAQGIPVEAEGLAYYVKGLTAQAEGTDAGTYTANVTGTPQVFDAAGNDVTAQFAVTPLSGSLVIDKRPLTLVSANLSKPYDSRPLVNGDTPLATEDGWVSGQGATYVFTGSVALPGETAPNAFVIKVKDGTNLDNYAVSKTEGQLAIENRGDNAYEVEVTANSGTFTYDGTQKTVSGFVGETAAGIPVQAEGSTYYVTGLQSTASGVNVLDSAASIPVQGTVAVVDADGNVVTDQFKVNVVPGSLTIQPAELTIRADDTGKRYGDGDPALSATITGLKDGDVFEGSYDVTRAAGENAGTYEITVGNVQLGAGSNYTAATLPGTFTIAPVDSVTLVVNGGSKPYDGTPLVPNGFTPIGLAPGDTVEVVFGGSQTDAGASEGTITDYIIRNAAGEDVTGNYPNVTITPGELTVTAAQATIVVDSASKVAGADDPAFAGTVTGLVAEGDLGDISYSRTNADEEAGVYADVITATFTNNPNYAVTVVPGTFTITAPAVVPPVPTPGTPTTPTTPGTPQTTTPATPLPPAPAAPGTPLPGNPVTPIIAPVVDALQNAVETVIGPTETPLAGPQEETIDDNGNPLAGYDRVNCWVHYYLILGIIVTLVYGAVVLVRRMRFTHQLKAFEDDVLGIEDDPSAVPAAAPLATEGKEA